MRPYFSRGLGAALVVSLLLAGPAAAQALEETVPTVLVSGEGIVRVEPDQATVRFGVVTQAEDPETARAQNAEAARDALRAVRALGIEERDIRLETLRLEPIREFDRDRRRYNIVGYQAVRTLVVEVEDLEQLPTLVARIVQSGANRLDGISYDVADREAARNEALREAVLSAQEKAQLLAQTLGRTIGSALRITEQSFDFPRPMPYMARDLAVAEQAEAAPEPEAYAAGEIEVRATVQVTFRLE